MSWQLAKPSCHARPVHVIAAGVSFSNPLTAFRISRNRESTWQPPRHGLPRWGLTVSGRLS